MVKKITVDLGEKLVEDLDKFLAENGGSRTTVIICALREFLQQFEPNENSKEK
jgi:metal-responsive CopG/Arc/MetJ family transcriptional regulator